MNNIDEKIETGEIMETNDKKLYKIIGQNIKYYRQLYNLNKGKMTQEMLAEKVNVSTALIGNLESSKIDQGLSVITLYKISQVLDRNIVDFFTERHNNQK